MIRSLVLFTHVVGVIALFAALILEWLGFDSVQRATTRAEALPWVRVNMALQRVYGIAFATIIASGFYLGRRFGVLGDGWMLASYGTLVLMGILGGPIMKSRVRALQRAVEDPSDRALAALRSSASDSLLRVSLHSRIALGFAVVYLMIGKPEIRDSLVVVGIAAVLAIVTSLRKRQAGSAFVEGYR
jgi:hypothetical protein